MSEEAFFNPINPDKVAENPGLLPYAHTAGGAVIKPDDMGKVKGRSMLAMRQQTDRQMNQLYEQMEVLARQAKLLADRKEISERIYDAAMGFEPIISETYYLYEKENGADLLSLVAPEEWGRSFKYSRFLAKVTLLADHTWEVEYNESNQ
ncbi:DUF2452 domain-containing protein [Aquirufa antheringensis]|jgi:hypothetical protein|uniref:DUF2452 domain-containing protein n=3 Tax=Aquirufa TaxID=2676247 RepID=A0A4V2IVR3_9BACT|nr:DUF2452 domain-containing protein [Aquirufa antheringensis]MCE4216439.1 DUF2452 domain-containing protein [Pseudarcicella sp. GAP-15]MCL9968597.1 DUF2452 domain-containing protein [Aquirufa antheringensis]MCZ2476851.1 DUF2452 domain-containing protein [Aquirufa antheringensis]MCZ2485935.1 DUF2452 domain-containing protein [Aquirufa antheringensis]MCZ2486374.1 DUF2452 domain-containing protein [Aquirufa antheringensis]